MIKIDYINEFHITPIIAMYFKRGEHPACSWHEHAFYELAFVFSGEAVHECAGQRIPISAGDVLLLSPGVMHNYTGEKNIELFNVIYNAQYLHLQLFDISDDPLIKRILPKKNTGRKSAAFVEPIMHLDGDKLAKVRDLLENLYAECNSGLPGHTSAAIAIFTRLLVTLCRCGGNDAINAACPDHLRRAITFMNENYHDHLLTMADIAAGAGTSVRHLYRFFKNYTGHSPWTYLSGLRVNKAAEMLLNSREKISDIAWKCGFADGNYFSKKFAEYTGYPPGKFRQTHLK